MARASVATLLLLYLALDGCVTEVSAATRVHHRHRERNHEEHTEAVPEAPEVAPEVKPKKRDRREQTEAVPEEVQEKQEEQEEQEEQGQQEQQKQQEQQDQQAPEVKPKKRDRKTKYGQAKAFVKGQWQKYEKLVLTKNVIDVALGLMIGGAMTTLINSIVQNIMTPISVGLSMPGEKMNRKFFVVKQGDSGEWDYKNITMADADNAITVKWGVTSNDFIDFLFITVAIFLCKQFTTYVAKKIGEIDYEEYLDNVEDRIGLNEFKTPKCCDLSTPDPPDSYPNVCADGSAGIAYDRECDPKMAKVVDTAVKKAKEEGKWNHHGPDGDVRK